MQWFRRFQNNCSIRRRTTQVTVGNFEQLELRVVPSSVVVTPLDGLVTTEAGGTTSFSVVLDSPPLKGKKPLTAQIPIRSTDPTEGTVSTNRLLFDSSNWNVPQTVIVTGVADSLDDGPQNYTIQLGKLITKAKKFKKLDPPDVRVTNSEGSVAGQGTQTDLIASGFPVIEEGSTATVEIKLKSAPTDYVDLSVALVTGASQAKLSTSLFSFTPANWNVAQTLTLTGINTDGADGDHPIQLQFASTSNDAAFDAQISSLDGTVRDRGIKTLEGTVTGVIHTEPGPFGFPYPYESDVEGDFSFTFDGTTLVYLQKQYSEAVLQSVSLSTTEVAFTLEHLDYDTGLGDIDSARFVGTVSNLGTDSMTMSGTWTGTGDFTTGSGTWSIGVSVPASVVFGTRGTIILPEGDVLPLTVSLSTRPTGNVEVRFYTDLVYSVRMGFNPDTGFGTSLTFTPENWNIPQTVQLRGIETDAADGSIVDKLIAYVTSSDPRFEELAYDQYDLGAVLSVYVQDPMLNGVYTGTITGGDPSSPVEEGLELLVSGNEITGISPVAVSGTARRSSILFTQATGPLAGAIFEGSPTRNSDGTIRIDGTWSINTPERTASGTFSITRPAPAVPSIAESWYYSTYSGFGFPTAPYTFEFTRAEPHLLVGEFGFGGGRGTTYVDLTLTSQPSSPNVFRGVSDSETTFVAVFSEAGSTPATCTVYYWNAVESGSIIFKQS